MAAAGTSRNAQFGGARCGLSDPQYPTRASLPEYPADIVLDGRFRSEPAILRQIR